MAKSARSSVRKRNNAKLRSTVFGPAADARTARLSAKLQELASLPGPAQERKNANMEVDPEERVTTQTSDEMNTAESTEEPGVEDMDVDYMFGNKDTSKSGSRKKKSNKIEKKNRRKKARNSITFRKPEGKQQRSLKRK